MFLLRDEFECKMLEIIKIIVLGIMPPYLEFYDICDEVLNLFKFDT